MVEVNQEACDCLGYDREELSKLCVGDVVAGERNGAPLPATGTVQVEYRRRDGSTLPVEVRLESFEHRRQALVLASARDVTETRRAELLESYQSASNDLFQELEKVSEKKTGKNALPSVLRESM